MTIKEYVKIRKEEIRDIISKMTRPPFLAIVQINEDAGSTAYVNGKLKDALELGVKAELIKLPINTSESED